MSQVTPENVWRVYAQEYRKLFTLLPLQAMFSDVLRELALKPDSRILDLGCGTGFLMKAIMRWERVRPRYVGIDSSREMLDQAARQFYTGDMMFYQANLSDPSDKWGPGGQRFDRIAVINSLYALPDPVAVLRNIKCLAAPDVRLVASLPAPGPDMDAVAAEHLRLFEKVAPKSEPKEQWFADEAQRLDRDFALIRECNRLILSQGTFPTETDLRQWFTDAGWFIIGLSQTYAAQNWLVTAVLRDEVRSETCGTCVRAGSAP